MQIEQREELSDWNQFGMSVANLSCVVTQRPDRGDGLHGAEGLAGFVVISMYEYAFAVVLLHGSQTS
jgi:hypothetical protein